MQIRIRIVNPIPGEARYLSFERARKHCQRGIATFTEDGQLRFLNNERAQRRPQDALNLIQASAIRQYRNGKGVVFWNGETDPTLRHRPGEARS